jgi:hypothetical protein
MDFLENEKAQLPKEVASLGRHLFEKIRLELKSAFLNVLFVSYQHNHENDV